MNADLSSTNLIVCVFAICIVPLAIAGLALINTGLIRSRSASQSMMASLCVVAIAAVVYFSFGFAFEGFAGHPAHSLLLGGKAWNWLGADPFFLRGLLFDDSRASLACCFQILVVGLAAIIPLGAGAERWRIGAICLSTLFLAGWIYPLFAHWAWGGGWLEQLGANYGFGHGFFDAGGSSSIHAVGGLAALSVAWILGPRRSKYSVSGGLGAIPGHNTVFVLFGALAVLIGWFGLNSAGAILFAGIEPAHLILVLINTILAAASGALAAALITRIRFGRPDASITANGWVGGLVASSAACAVIKPPEMVIVGMIAGGLVTFTIDWAEFYLKLDDPSGSISVHAIAGLWGVLAVGLFANFPGNSGQFLAQIIGIATLLGFVLPLAYGINWLLNHYYVFRVSPDGERQGMDLHELGADAYPEFVTHNDDFMPR